MPGPGGIKKVRASHTKSRGGCRQCKQSHVKCDETVPTCRLCIKRGLQCSLDPVTRVSATPSSVDREVSIATPDDAPTPPPPPHPRHLLELKLMHHYSTSTCESLRRESQDRDQWQILAVEEALSHPFLLDCLMALSSLHLAFLETDKTDYWRRTALEYQDRATSGFRYMLNHIGPENCEAAYIASIMIMLLTLAFPGSHEQWAASDPMSEILSMRLLLQGVGAVMTEAMDVIKNGKFRHSLANDTFEGSVDADVFGPATPPLYLTIRDALKQLHTMNAASEQHQERPAPPAAPANDSCCRGAIEWLQKALNLYLLNGTMGGIIAWPTLIEQDFVVLLQEKQPIALLAFAHYAVLLHLLHDRWWARNAGRRLIEGLLPSLRALEPAWSARADWAVRTIMGGE